MNRVYVTGLSPREKRRLEGLIKAQGASGALRLLVKAVVDNPPETEVGGCWLLVGNDVIAEAGKVQRLLGMTRSGLVRAGLGRLR